MAEARQDDIFPSSCKIKSATDEYTVYSMDFSDGSGSMTTYAVMSGVTLIFNDFHTTHGLPAGEVHCQGTVEINHCHSGQFACILSNGRSVSLGPQDFSVSDMERPPAWSGFPVGEYCGISLIIQLETAQRALYRLLDADAPDLNKLFDKLFSEQPLLILRTDPKVQQLFSELYDMPQFCQKAYFKLKTAELILFLSRKIEEQSKGSPPAYFSRDNCRRVQAIEQYMIQHLPEHIPLSALSARFKMGESTLKKHFLQLYGVPPYAYLKRKRMERAAFLLETTDLPIGEIAAVVGYQNASKFSTSFGEIYTCTPSNYKKGIRLE